MEKRPTILFVTPILHHPPTGGPELRIENSIKALSRCADIFIYGRLTVENAGGSRAIDFYRRFAKEIFIAPSGKRRNLFQRGFRHAAHLAVRYASGRSLKDEIDFRSILSTAERIGADAVWLGFGNISYPLLAYLKSRTTIPVVLDTDSVWSRFVLRALPYAEDALTRSRIETEGKTKEREEAWGTRMADVTTAVSGVDAEYYRSLAERPEQVRIFSNGIDLESYRQVAPPSGFRQPAIFLAGTFGTGSPMEDAARWMIQEVLPLVKREIPAIHFVIAGVQSRQVLADVVAPDVSIMGEVESVLPYLSNAAVSVVPLRFESGTRFKILEAGACRVPVVSTTLGAEGIPVTDGKNILLADSPERFAECVVRLVQDREFAREIGTSLHRLVAEHYGIPALSREARDILAYLQVTGSETNQITRLECFPPATGEGTADSPPLERTE